MIARITARHRECAFAGSRTRLLGILTLRPASQLEHSPTRFVSLKLAGWRFCKSPLNPTDANSHRSALWVRVDKICSHLPLAWRLLYLLADNKTKRHFRDRHEAIDDESDAYCWRRSGFFWRMRASLGLACAQATTLASQVLGKGNPRFRAGRTSA